MSGLTTEDLRKTFGQLVAVNDVSLSVEEGELWCLLGPSGCGKSTTLRMIGGLGTPTDGTIYLNDEDVTNTPAYQRDTSMVFQNWALFPQKTVLENVAFGPKMQGAGKDERHKRAQKYLDMIQMTQFEDSQPSELSGGQQQRVALARSLAMDPHVLLLDEPLSNLDKRLREEMQIELKRIHEELEKTMIYVTHDQNEAFTLADRIGIMNDGNLVQVGEPREVYDNPKNQFIEEFLGDTNFLTTQVVQTGAKKLIVETPNSNHLRIPTTEAGNLQKGMTVTVSLRPEFLTVEKQRASQETIRPDGNGGGNSLRGTVTSTLYRGSTIRYYIDIGENEVFVEQSVGSNQVLEHGDTVTVSWDADDLICFDEQNQRLS
jgi:spermidine/putrescine transport system ATP-binding protein